MEAAFEKGSPEGEGPPGVAGELVSVLMPVYRPDLGMLDEAVRSVLGNSRCELELVVVEDPSPQTAEEYFGGFSDGSITYLLNGSRTSLTAQLNKGLSLCRGEYVARMDADDVSLPGRFDRQLEYLNNNPDVSVVGTNLEYVDESGNSLGFRKYPETHEDIVSRIALYSPIAHATVMFRKPDLIRAGGYQADAPVEDWDLWCRMHLMGMRFHNLQAVLYRYRHHPEMGKMKGLKKTITAGLELKDRYFRHGGGAWGVREATRYYMEKLLLVLPAPVIMKLFFILSADRRH